MKNRWARALLKGRRPAALVALVALVVIALVVSKAAFTSARFVDGESATMVLQAVGNWYDFAWHWRVPITITNSGPALSDYQIRITINTAALIAGGKLQSSGNDLRFTGPNGMTAIGYWIDTGINTSATIMWVRVPFIPAGSSTIYMYYGNALAGPASSGDNTFIFFDDFENGFTPGAKWTVLNPSAGAVSLSTSNVFHGANSLRVTDSPNGLNLGVSASFSPQTNCVIEYGIYFTVQGSKEIQISDPAGNIGPRGGFTKSKGGSDTLQFYVTNWQTIGNFPASAWYQSRLVIADMSTTSDNYSLYFYNSTGGLLAQANDVRFFNNADLSVLARFTYVGTSDSRTDTYLDLVKVRAYAAVEPTCSIGNEQ